LLASGNVSILAQPVRAGRPGVGILIRLDADVSILAQPVRAGRLPAYRGVLSVLWFQSSPSP